MNRRDFLGSSAAVAVAACTPSPAQSNPAQTNPPQTNSDAPANSAVDALNPPGIRVAGIRMIPVVGGRYKVWTKRIGSGPIKVLLLHGGPGVCHDYLEAFESFLPQAGIEMYYYDQLGCGNSDQPDDPALWNLPRYLIEVEEVRRGLGLDHFVLIGHSWGGMLALEYALNYQPHLRGLVISNMCAGMQSYLKRIAALKSQLLPPAELAKFNALEAAKDYDNPEYQRIVMEHLYTKMLCRIQPWPEPVTRAFRIMNEKIYNQMQGKSEFEVTGNIRDWERWDRLHEIKTKALTIGANYDEMDPADMKKMATLMPNATFGLCPNGSHLDMWDDQATYFDHILTYLKSV
jgi:proline iminopeptidase